MSDPTNRFTTRVENYVKYRPGYPRALIDLLEVDCGLDTQSIIADVGSGTGILSEMFLKRGIRVLGVEPNQPMRIAAERLLSGFPQFTSIDGSAEATTLPADSVDFVTAAQAFHWFDSKQARAEFARILKSAGWVVLIWNERRLDSTSFLREYERLLIRYGTDYQKVRHENVTEKICDFFAPQSFSHKSFENFQVFDLEGFQGRVRSASYTPEPGSGDFEAMMSGLNDIFEKHHKTGQVTFEYDTTVYYGQLKQA